MEGATTNVALTAAQLDILIDALYERCPDAMFDEDDADQEVAGLCQWLAKHRADLGGEAR